MLKYFKALFLLVCLTDCVYCKGVMYNFHSLPQSNWITLSSHNFESDGILRSNIMCSIACLSRGEDCDGFEMHADGGSCTLGRLQAFGDNNYFPEYVNNGKKVYLHASKVKRKAVTGVTHLASIRAGNTVDSAFEDKRFGPIDIPPPLPNGIAIMTINYSGGFLSCGGTDENNTYSKKCR